MLGLEFEPASRCGSPFAVAVEMVERLTAERPGLGLLEVVGAVEGFEHPLRLPDRRVVARQLELLARDLAHADAAAATATPVAMPHTSAVAIPRSQSESHAA